MTSGYFPLVPPREDWLERRIRALEQQVLELQAGRKLSSASFRGGAFRFLDDSGQPRHVFGNVELSGEIGGVTSAYGDLMFGDEGAIILGGREGDRGLMYPFIPQPMVNPTPQFVTSSSFVNIFEGRYIYPAHEVFFVTGAYVSAASTTGEIRLKESFSGQTTDVASISAGKSGYYTFGWLHPATTGLYDPRDRPTGDAFMAIEARRVSGSGDFNVWPPQVAAWMSHFLIGEADTNGAPSS